MKYALDPFPRKGGGNTGLWTKQQHEETANKVMTHVLKKGQKKRRKK